MNIELILLNGYGQFVWPAFIFTFLSCYFLYIKTQKEFKKIEKIYLQEFKEKENLQIQVIKAKKKYTRSLVW